MRTRSAWLIVAILVAFVAGLGFLLSRAPRGQRTVATPPPRPVMTPAGREELKKFQGRWEFVSLEVDGEPKPEADFKKYTVDFKDDQWMVSEGSNIAAQCTIVLDPIADPKTIDAFPPPGKGLPIHGIYLLEGDKLTVCDRGEDNGERPTDFGPDPNPGLVRIVYRRPPP
jgi:uncharacterized protein (TIGR03067 family)